MRNDVLVIHEPSGKRDLLLDILAAGGYECRVADDRASAQRAMRRRPSLVVLSGLLDGAPEECLAILARLADPRYPIPVVVTGVPRAAELARQAMVRGAYGIVERPWNSVELLHALHHAIEDARRRREAADARIRAALQAELVGTSDATMRLREAIVRATNSDAPLLITGEIGCGKESTARLIHQKSRRAKHPFIVMNCAAAASDDVDAALFGIDMGDQQDNWIGTILGALDQADGGTLLLENIQALPDDCQHKLLLLLTNGSFMRAQGSIGVEVDARVMVTTTGDELAAAAAAGRARQDLYDLLRSNRLDVPSLAERQSDIPLLAKHFLKRLSEAAGLPVREIEAPALAALQAASWPGNVRELRNAVERMLAVVWTTGGPIALRHLPPEYCTRLPTGTDGEGPSAADAFMFHEGRAYIDEQFLFARVMGFDGKREWLADAWRKLQTAFHRNHDGRIGSAVGGTAKLIGS
jgi:two-component system nitrogen regulation response regulator NtrX